MHHFGWLSERGGNVFDLLQKEWGTQKGWGGGGASEKGGSSTEGNYGASYHNVRQVKCFINKIALQDLSPPKFIFMKFMKFLD